MFKYILHSFLVCVLTANCFAQEGLKPLTTNINYLYGDLKPIESGSVKNSYNRSVSSATTTAPIFLDDFSYSYLQAYPDQSLWSGFSTYVNSTSAIAPWSIGVATFDGLNKNGYPYTPNLVNQNTSLPADTLTSKPINLKTIGTQTLFPADSVALIFYYQARGYGEAPELTDSLLLDFYNPLQSTWKTVWYKRGNSSPNTNDTMFKRGYVKIDSAYYLENGFKFRFRNKATTSGNYDHWHLDYVFIDRNLSYTADTSRSDFAFGYIPTPFLKNYSAMPWKQYAISDMRRRNSVFVRSNGLLNSQITYTNTIYDNNNIPVSGNTSGNIPVDEVTDGFFKYKGWMRDSGIFTPKNTYDFPLMTGPNDYKIKHIIYRASQTNPDFVKANDTVLQHQVFSNFYAFDDGSAEAGYYVNGFGGRMAGKYVLKVSDTLRSVKIYFDQVGSIASQLYKFRIYIWAAGANGPANQVIYRDSAQTPNYFPNGSVNSFSEYYLPSPIVLNAGTYYIGIRQEVATGVIIGFDRNLDHSSSFYYDSGSGWTPSAIRGSIMIRPVFGVYIPVGITENKIDKINLFNVYPNPASGRLTIRSENSENGSYTLINSIGQTISEGKIEDREQNIATENLSNGLYFLIFKINDKPIQQNKIIIQH